VDVRSLGYRTDLIILAHEGSQIIDHGDHLVIRSPANPAYWWGNFLLLAAPPGPGETGTSLSRFAGQFPEARHVALGIDVTDDEAVDASELLAAGLHLQRSTVMTASKVHDPPHPNRGATYRQLTSDSDWQQAARLLRGAARRRPRVRRGENRRGARPDRSWARILVRRVPRWSVAGAAGPGHRRVRIARYQNVQTHPAARRQGLAGTLVCHAARQVLDTAGASTLVMVADPADNAIRVYRAAGFADAETQIGFERPPPTGGDG